MSRYDTSVRESKCKEAISRLAEKDVRDKISKIGAKKEYSAFFTSIKSLNSLTESLYEKDKHGVPKLLEDTYKEDETNLAKLKRAYNLSKELAGLLHTRMQQNRDEMGDVFESAFSSLRNIESGITSDISVLTTFTSDEKLTLPKLMYKSSVKTYDISDSTGITIDDKQSSHVPIELVNSDGQKVNGFFTKSSNYDPLKYFKEEADKARKKHEEKVPPMVLEAYDEMVNKIIRSKNSSLIFNLGKKDSKTKQEITFASYAGSDPNIILGLSTKNLKMFQNMLSDLTKNVMGNKELQNKVDSSRRLTYGSNVDRRSSAVSDIASLLGMNDIISESNDIKVKNSNGEIIEGTFTELSEGVPLGAVNFTGKQSQFTPNAKMQLADLQILDYICLNINRHPGNLLFKQDKNNKITGIVGINNESSFGNVTHFDGESFNRLTNLSEIKYISADMARNLSRLDSGTVKEVLKARGLPNSEISAALTRFNDCKALAKKAYERVNDTFSPQLDTKNYAAALSDLDFGQVKMQDIPKKGHGESNIFTSLMKYSEAHAKKDPEKSEQVDFSERKGVQADATERSEESLKKALQTLREYKEKLKDATGLRGRSKNYKNIQNALDSSIELIEDTLSDKRLTKMSISPSDYSECMNSLKNVYEAADHYSVNKAKEKGRSNYANKRLKLANEFRNSLSETISNMEFKQDKDRDEMEVMNINKISSMMLEDIMKTEDAMTDFSNAKSPMEKADIILYRLPKLSSQAYASFDNKIDELIEDSDLVTPKTARKLMVAKTISEICKKGREATSILAVNSENQSEKLGKGKTFANIDECKLAFAKMKLVDNILNSRGTANVQNVFEEYGRQCKNSSFKGKDLDTVIDNVVKNGNFYKDLKAMDFRETLNLLDNSNIRNRKAFISISTDMDTALNIRRLGAKLDDPSYVIKSNRI